MLYGLLKSTLLGPALRLGFRPHVSVQGERRVHRGDTLVLDDFALVDMAPEGDTSVRAVVAAWGSGA